jgi:four helix bundle protein
LNIAEGAGKFSPADEAVFYTRARGSATESAAVLCRKLNLIPTTATDENTMLLGRMAQMPEEANRARARARLLS